MLILVVEKVEDFQVCGDCGEEIPDPYFEKDAKVICSRCQADRGHRYWLDKQAEGRREREVLEPAKCVCGFLLPECQAGTCKPLTDVPQRKLF